jgi:hypothetical protein
MICGNPVAALRHCSVHHRVYIPTLARWLALPGTPDQVSPGGVRCEDACDVCLQTAKACLKRQFPDLYSQSVRRPRIGAPEALAPSDGRGGR